MSSDYKSQKLLDKAKLLADELVERQKDLAEKLVSIVKGPADELLDKAKLLVDELVERQKETAEMLIEQQKVQGSKLCECGISYPRNYDKCPACGTLTIN